MNLSTVLGVAQAEARLCRRLVRYWVFVVLGIFFALLLFSYYTAVFTFFSSYSPSIGIASPRYLATIVGGFYMAIFAIGLIFIAFDVRARDQRERVAEVLDSRPYSNLELVSGRFLAHLAVAWVPMAVAIGLAQLAGMICIWLGADFGGPMEPRTVVLLLFGMALPAMVCVLGMVYLVSLLTRHRLIAAVVLLALIGGAVWFSWYYLPTSRALPYDLLGAFSLVSASDLLRGVTSAQALLQRLAVVLLGLGMVGLAVALHPRRESDSRTVPAAVGGALVVLALAICVGIDLDLRADNARVVAWRAAHEARAHEPVPDLEAVRGTVEIDPGRELRLDLALEISAPPDGAALAAALLTLNPGLTVDAVGDGGGGALRFTHRDGLLEVELAERLAPGASTVIELTAHGVPDGSFAYLDSSIDATAERIFNNGTLALGFYPSLFNRRSVTLLPGTFWLPASGVDFGRDDVRRRPTDFFTLDLTVVVPPDWLPAAPGRRRAEGEGRYRFAPPAPLPEVALVAAPFERHAAEIEGVEVELLLYPGHGRNPEQFADAAEEIRTAIGELLSEAAQIGLTYPYDSLTMVEVPYVLRVYGGGWRMGSVMAPPAMLLLPETSFPAARFEWRWGDKQRYAEREDGLPGYKRELLETFFENDISGANPFTGVARSFFAHQTGPTGPDALPLGFLTEALTARLVTGRPGYFSVYLYKDANQNINLAIGQMFTNASRSFANAVQDMQLERPVVWDQALAVTLGELDPSDQPGRAVNVLLLKGGALARSIEDELGREKAGALLAGLRQRTAGGSFTRADLLAVGEEIGVDLEQLLADWLDTTTLPGFVTSAPRLTRLADEDGAKRYQLAVDIYNDEPVPGLLSLYWATGEANALNWDETEPLRVAGNSAIEVGIVTGEPPTRLRVSPYLALNRGVFELDLPPLDEERISAAEPLRGSLPSDWRPAVSADIVVDDLDPGFSVVAEEAGGFRLGGEAEIDPATLDQGLPELIFGPPPPRFSRAVMATAWGKYRHTAAVVATGTGDQKARFTAELPTAGRWRLDLHIPAQGGRARGVLSNAFGLGEYKLRLIDGSDRGELSFAARTAEAGWNVIDEFDLAAGEVSVELHNGITGQALIADAIRWRPVDDSTPADDLPREEEPDA